MYQDSSFSKKDIIPFIASHPSINMSEYKQPDPQRYPCFNAFFHRKIKKSARPIAPDITIENNKKRIILTSPADGKLYIVPRITSESKFFIKGKPLNLTQFLQDPMLAQQYEGADLYCFRISPDNYHRYHFPINCVPLAPLSLGKKLESVNRVAYTADVNPLQNHRTLIPLNTSCGQILMISVGAMLVGRDTQTFTPEIAYQKGDEAGYFDFGGSTVVLLIPRTAGIEPLEKYLQHSALGYETEIRMGEPIAHALSLSC
jgi:phosphatidylserine decarboxylase